MGDMGEIKTKHNKNKGGNGPEKLKFSRGISMASTKSTKQISTANFNLEESYARNKLKKLEKPTKKLLFLSCERKFEISPSLVQHINGHYQVYIPNFNFLTLIWSRDRGGTAVLQD